MLLSKDTEHALTNLSCGSNLMDLMMVLYAGALNCYSRRSSEETVNLPKSITSISLTYLPSELKRFLVERHPPIRTTFPSPNSASAHLARPRTEGIVNSLQVLSADPFSECGSRSDLRETYLTDT